MKHPMNPPTSTRRRSLVVGLVVIALIITGYALRSHLRHGHGHEHAHDQGAAGLSLNDGQRWATDEPLRLGMQRIRDAVTPALADSARQTLTREQARVMAGAVQENVTFLIQNCKLTPAADANLHFLITELVTGAALVSADPRSEEGAMKLTHALAEYPKYFDHPNWTAPAPTLPIEQPDHHK